MRIAYDPQIFSAQKYGGISRYICEIASRIAKESNVQISVIAPMYINAYLEQLPSKLVSGFQAFDTYHLQMLQRGLSMVIGDIMLRVARPDIVHETYYSPYRLGPRSARRVLTIHDMINEKFGSHSSLAERTTRYKALAAERADHVIFVSKSTQRDAIDILGLSPEKTSVIYHGFDLIGIDKGRTEGLTLPTRNPFLLYVGNRGGYKNFSGLLQAYASSPQLRVGYDLVCFGGGGLNADELTTIQKLGLHRNKIIQLAGNDQTLARLYDSASAFIYPSLYEGFGIPPLEAMAHDCPVICSNTSSIPEVVGDAGEYFEPNDIDSMRIGIERVVGAIDYRTTLIEKGRARLKYFSWDRCALETFNVYMRLT